MRFGSGCNNTSVAANPVRGARRSPMRRWCVAMAAMVLASAARADEAAAVAALEKLGAKIKRDETRPDKPVVEVIFFKNKVMDFDLAQLKNLKSIQLLSLHGTMVTDAGLTHLKDVKTLQELHLPYTAVTDAGLVHLKDLKSLHTLNLSSTKITDKGLAHLKDLKNLHTLWIGENCSNGRGIGSFQRSQSSGAKRRRHRSDRCRAGPP
jgi:hypothetical protein